MATKYIATTGNDTTGDGSASLPWKTLAKAVTGTSVNDTIYVYNGTYTAETVNTAGRHVLGQSQYNVIFDGGGTDKRWIVANNGVGSLTNIRLTDITTGVYAIAVGGSGNTVSFTNCIFDDMYFSSTITANFDLIAISNNTSTISFTRCIFYRLSFLTGTEAPMMFYNATGSTLNLDHCVIILNDTVDTVATDAFDQFVYNTAAEAAINITNCILYSFSSTNKAKFCSSNTKRVESYNCYYNGSETLTGTGDLNNTDPLFVDRYNGNFHLRPSSPCIGAGNS